MRERIHVCRPSRLTDDENEWCQDLGELTPPFLPVNFNPVKKELNAIIKMNIRKSCLIMFLFLFHDPISYFIILFHL